MLLILHIESCKHVIYTYYQIIMRIISTLYYFHNMKFTPMIFLFLSISNNFRCIGIECLLKLSLPFKLSVVRFVCDYTLVFRDVKN